MKLRVGTLVPNTETPVGEGLNGATRAVIRIDGISHGAVIKRIPFPAVLAECFCGILLRLWELPTPEPVLIFDNGQVLFASMDAGYPNLKKRLNWSDSLPESQKQVLIGICARIVCNWSDLPRALAADEAISNADRNLGNFLWDGTDHAYIDHERTLGLFPHLDNKIAQLAIIAQKQDHIERAGIAAALTLDRGAPTRVVGDGLDFSTFVAHVERQLGVLANLVLLRFPKPADLLSGLQNDQ
ncbi:hypothetical protein J5T34_18590 [Cupriavidus gilardii]|uniref:hypothetical protein n=1 Tax=Cupriavidus gilardii TaxID=82541 RepID=UPI001ABE1C2B|nr:hypothetical protein [Cupriavidus gilardii]MBO4122740.1 hypothetical protein [Cupriavidus gilardii]